MTAFQQALLKRQYKRPLIETILRICPDLHRFVKADIELLAVVMTKPSADIRRGNQQAVSRDGMRLASASQDKTIKVWDVSGEK